MTSHHLDLDFGSALEAVRRLVGGPTPTVRAHDLDERAGRPVWLKLDCLQRTGSFKVRGAAAFLAALEPEARARGVVTCSSGNHGRAVARVARALGVPAVVFVPEWVDPVKLEAIRADGAEARVEGATYDESEELAAACARERGLTFVPPFDDERIVAGQGTVATEVLEVVPEPGEVAVPLSGGGLAGGMAEVLARRSPATRVTAVSAARAAVMVESVRAGRPVAVPEEETLAGALAGGIGLENRVTFALVRDRVHRHVLVEEDAIAGAVRDAYRRGLVVEGGGAVALAALLEGRLHAGEDAPPGALVLVLSGGNLDPAVLSRLVS